MNGKELDIGHLQAQNSAQFGELQLKVAGPAINHHPLFDIIQSVSPFDVNDKLRESNSLLHVQTPEQSGMVGCTRLIAGPMCISLIEESLQRN